ncbi:cell division protein [Cellulophaga sp. HaHaR_3_176]|uniref:SRPBCC family protein n=1 Tax=Cellulophaga sp. HaHaR_3_176 TaxID=1942464 RepID=UPI00352C9A5D
MLIFYKLSTSKTNETAIAGKTSGLISLGESVTWRAKHFGVYQNLTSKITVFEKPDYFVDEMVSGAFNSFKHEHIFEDKGGFTLMIDVFHYEAPLGILGKLANILFLKKYMIKFLTQKNIALKEIAENGTVNQFLET